MQGSCDQREDDEDRGPVKVLKRDSTELLRTGNRNINDILDVKADDYHDKGYSEEEISSRLKNDKLELQREFLHDAFPGQDVAPVAFHLFDKESK